MRILLFTISIFCSYVFYAQDDFSSFYFKTSQPANTPSVFKIADSFIGSYYKENDSLVRIVIDKDSIYTEFGILFILSSAFPGSLEEPILACITAIFFIF